MLYRVLFTLGLLSKHFDVESDEFKEFKICTKHDLIEILFSSLIYKVSLVKEETKDVDSLNEKEILINSSREVEKSCKKIVDFLIENV